MPTLASRFLGVLTLLPLTVLAQATANPAPATPYIDGAWAGALDFGPMQLHIVFHIARTAVGLTATMDGGRT